MDRKTDCSHGSTAVNRRPEVTGQNGCKGQAATEFTIIASFVLVPLFLLIPLLGRYIDIKQACVQQARFEAWEYTAWYDKAELTTDFMQSLIDKQRAGKREFFDTRKKGNLLFFSDITDPHYGTELPLELNPLWIDHRGDTLFSPRMLNQNAGLVEKRSPDPTLGLIDRLLSLINMVTQTFGKLLKVLHVKADFNALNSNGNFTSNFQVDVRTSRQVVPDISNPASASDPSKLMIINAQASVLARGWTAGSTDNASSESKGLVVTSLLSPVSKLFNGVVDILQRVINVAKHVMPIDFRLPHGPDFGHMQDDPIPYEHLVGDRRKTRENDGLYYYREE